MENTNYNVFFPVMWGILEQSYSQLYFVKYKLERLLFVSCVYENEFQKLLYILYYSAIGQYVFRSLEQQPLQ